MQCLGPKSPRPHSFGNSHVFTKLCVFLISPPEPLLTEQFLRVTDLGVVVVFVLVLFRGFPFLISLKKNHSKPEHRPLLLEQYRWVHSTLICCHLHFIVSLPLSLTLSAP